MEHVDGPIGSMYLLRERKEYLTSNVNTRIDSTRVKAMRSQSSPRTTGQEAQYSTSISPLVIPEQSAQYYRRKMART